MSLPLKWCRGYDSDPREVAKLGEIAVGAVMTRGGKSAEWIVWLPNRTGCGYAHWQPVKGGIEQAKVVLTAAILAWLTDAGVIGLADKTRLDAQSLPLFAEEMA